MFFKSLFLSAAKAVTEVIGETAATGAVTDTAFTFTPANFISNLYYMGVGMLAIFVVIAVIITLVYALDIFVRALTKKAPENK